ncbi:hypothetical protein AMS68_005906 [Peltaster fructicola]|uniref:V-SNARE coiled-coil homology domain-containing protein n=1 Tax=Peltaster fructicola TaxID=286661 RepID=A0A6H0Y0J2_9PEZI|nr:hypothetical protein AMS68_005906 [Peltaster fructicola]
MSNHDLYDPPAGHSNTATKSPNNVAQLHKDVDAVTDMMRHNIGLASERSNRIDELQGQSENLSQNARGFNRRANQLRKDMWWKDMKMRICIIVGIVVLLVVIIAPSVYFGNKNKNNS